MMQKTLYTVVDLIAGLFVLLFSYTAIDKLSNLRTFHSAIYASEVIRPYVGFLQYAVPVAEAALVLLLLLPPTRKAGLIGSTLLMALFTAYVAAILASSKHLPCSCGGIIRRLTWTEHLWLNSVFTGLGLGAIYVYYYLFYRDKTGQAEHL